eukprot:360665-Chlamydomonas_euryale.AAC.4
MMTENLVRQLGFDRVNTAAYSARPNTPAAEREDQVADLIKADRLNRCGSVGGGAGCEGESMSRERGGHAPLNCCSTVAQLLLNCCSTVEWACTAQHSVACHRGVFGADAVWGAAFWAHCLPLTGLHGRNHGSAEPETSGQLSAGLDARRQYPHPRRSRAAAFIDSVRRKIPGRMCTTPSGIF